MQRNIEKTCNLVDNYKNDIYFFKSAREGFSEILKQLKKEYGNYTLLLPAYIGFSPNEGSGIYDPIINNKIPNVFYKINENIEVNIDDYKNKIKEIKGKKVVLLVNYFGYVDKNADEIIKIARDNDIYIIEDNAHALYTDYIDNNCGKKSDAVIYSLHKMLPVKNGGMVKLNNKKIKISDIQYNLNYNPFEYNFKEISDRRKNNVALVEEKLKFIDEIKILRPINEYKEQTPQTYPVVIKNKDKNEFYHRLNEDGFGVVSLYHTMIQPLKNQEYETSNEISKKILNIPIHQDVEQEQIEEMCKKIKELCEESNE